MRGGRERDEEGEESRSRRRFVLTVASISLPPTSGQHNSQFDDALQSRNSSVTRGQMASLPFKVSVGEWSVHANDYDTGYRYRTRQRIYSCVRYPIASARLSSNENDVDTALESRRREHVPRLRAVT